MAVSDLINLSALLGGEVFRTGAQPSLAAGRALSRLRQRGGDPQRPRRDATASATLSLQSLQRAFRRSDGYGAGWPPPAVAGVGAVSLPDGVEPLQSADRRGTRPEYVGRAGDDRTSAQRSGGADTSRQTGR